MKKIIFFIPFFLYAAVIDFSVCYKKYSFINNLIPVTKNRSITFSPVKNYLFYDPFTKMYVVKHKNKKIIKFFKNPSLGWWMAAIKKNSVYGGTYASKGYFLNFSKLSVYSPKNSVISDIFCRAYGIGAGGGFLDAKRIFHFVRYGYWGDVGIVVNKSMRVLYSDPFYTNIRPGEKILFINSKRATPKVFTDYILLAKAGKRVKIVTNKGLYILKIRKLKYNFTPLSYFGIKVDKNLSAYLPKKLAEKYFLKKGKIIKINGKKVTSYNELLYFLSFSKNVTITLRKNGIQLTIPLRK